MPRIRPISNNILLGDIKKRKGDDGRWRGLSEATVLAVGTGDHWNGHRVPINFTVGDRVLFENEAENWVKHDNKRALLTDAGRVVAIIEE